MPMYALFSEVTLRQANKDRYFKYDSILESYPHRGDMRILLIVTNLTIL